MSQQCPNPQAQILYDFFKDDGSNWTQQHFARDKHGDDVGWDSEDATCFCLMGANLRLNEKKCFEFQSKLSETILKEYSDFVKGHDPYIGPTSHFNDCFAADVKQIKELLTKVPA